MFKLSGILLILILILYWVFSGCSSKESKHSEKVIVSDSISLLPTKVVSSNSHIISLDTLWEKLVNKEGGCLVGGQRITNGKYESPRMIFNKNQNWDELFNLPDSVLAPFLFEKFADTSTTHIHTCPFFVATDGEVAVYCLQKIARKNWYDLKAFRHYKHKKGEGSTENHQIWLQRILASDKQREILTHSFRINI